MNGYLWRTRQCCVRGSRAAAEISGVYGPHLMEVSVLCSFAEMRKAHFSLSIIMGKKEVTADHDKRDTVHLTDHDVVLPIGIAA